MLLRREAAATLDGFAGFSAANSFSTVIHLITVKVRLAGTFFALASHRGIWLSRSSFKASYAPAATTATRAGCEVL
jgi:hypothetical protein